MANPIKDIVVKFKRYFLDIRFRNKILIVYVTLLAIPMIITSMLFYGYSSGLAKIQTEGMISNSLKQGATYAGSILQEIEIMGNVFYQNSNIQSMLANENNMDYEDLKEYEYILGTLSQIEQNKKVFGIKLYIPDWKYYAAEKLSIFPFSDIENDHAVKGIIERKKITGWTGIYEVTDKNNSINEVLTYVVIIVDLNNINNIIGALRIDILESTLAESIGNIGIEGKGIWGIADADGIVITSFGNGSFDLSEIVSDTGHSENVEGWTIRGKYSLVKKPINNNWMLIYAAPLVELTGRISKDSLFVLVVFLLLFFISLFSAMLISDRMTTKITGLSKRMAAIQKELKEQGPENATYISKDEVGMLDQSFDLMIERLRNLFIENYQAKLEKKEARLKLLQAQINPHFLYNVLDQINWMAVRANEQEISNMAVTLGRFYNIGLSKGEDIISLETELEHVKLYVGLQKYRLGDAIEFNFELDTSIMDLKISKLVLQPIVENAIFHGVLETDEQSGKIMIKTVKEETYACILVKDSAGLLKPEDVKNVIGGNTGSSEKGYGLKNVEERLKLTLGEEWGLQYYLDEAGWSVFQIRIPLV